MAHWPDFLFLRHGQTDWNLQGRLQGVADIPLNATGVDQAHIAAEALMREHVDHRSIDRIVSSPLSRALETAAVVSGRLEIPLDVDTRLIERSFGSFEGLVLDEVKREIGIANDVPISSYLPPDAEQWPDTLSRTRSVIGAWLDPRPDERVLFVAHHGLMAALSEHLTGVRKQGDNGVPYAFRRDGAVWSVSELGER